MPLWVLKFLGFVKGIPMKVWLIIAACVIFAIIGWKISGAISDHQKYVAGIEKSNAEYKATNERLNTRIGELGKINTDNKKVYDTSLQQAQEARRIADDERRKAEVRAERYRSIRNVPASIPEQDRQPVSTVIADTIGRLWDTDPRPAGNGDGGPRELPVRQPGRGTPPLQGPTGEAVVY